MTDRIDRINKDIENFKLKADKDIKDLLELCNSISLGHPIMFNELVMAYAATLLTEAAVFSRDRNRDADLTPISGFSSIPLIPEDVFSMKLNSLNPRKLPDFAVDIIVQSIAGVMKEHGVEIDEKKLKERIQKGERVLNLSDMMKGDPKTLQDLLGVDSMEKVNEMLRKEPKEEEKP